MSDAAEPMSLLDGIFSRKTTNGAFLPDPVSLEHQQLLIKAAGAAPSHFNSQPWRFILIDSREVIDKIADISGQCMYKLLDEGLFFERYKPYFRFSEKEMETRRDGIFIDKLPKALRPLVSQVTTGLGKRVMKMAGVPKKLAEDNRKLVAGSPLIIAVLLTKEEYRPGQLSGFYSLFGMGAAVENIWLTTGSLGMGIQFISTPMEVPEAWQEIQTLLNVPDELELMAMYRLGYLPQEEARPSIDWTSRQRKRLSQVACRNIWGQPEADPAE